MLGVNRIEQSQHGDRSPLFLVRSDGELVRMVPSAPSTEDDLQTLIATHPDLIGDSDGALLLIEREHGIPDAQEGSNRWSTRTVPKQREAANSPTSGVEPAIDGDPLSGRAPSSSRFGRRT